MKKTHTKPSAKSIVSVLSLGFFLLSFLFPSPLWAEDNLTVPESGINYSNSYLYISYTDEIPGFENVPGNFECFDDNPNVNNLADTNLEPFSRSLDQLGVDSSDDLIDILSGDASGCFQKSGTYYLMFKLKDNAGNCGLYPSGGTDCLYNVFANEPGTNPAPSAGATWEEGEDDLNWYRFVIKPSTPDGNQSTIEPDVADAAVTEVKANDGADNNFYTVTLTLRDQFGNVVTQLTDPNDVDVKIISTIDNIEIDGLFAEVIDGSLVDEAEAYENTDSKRTFTEGVFFRRSRGQYYSLSQCFKWKQQNSQ